jgi:hypothetical protein
VDAVRHLLARQPPTRGVHLLLLLRRGWVGAVDVLLPLYAAGVLWALATACVVTLPYSGGDLYPLL